MNGWTDTILGDEIDLAYGKSLPAHVRQAGPYEVFGSNGCVGHHEEPLIAGPGIIVGRKGSVGEVAYSEGDFWPIDTAYYVVNKGGHDWRFLFHLLSSLGLKGLNSHSAVPGLNREDAYSIGVSLPAQPEQKMIADALDVVVDRLKLEDEAIALSQDLKRAAMRVLFSNGLRGEAQKETEFGPVPATWDESLLDDCATVQTGAAKGRKFADAEVVEVPYLRVANVQDGHLDLTEMKEIRIRKSEIERYRLQLGDVVLTEGGDFDKLGRGFIWRGELELCVHQNHVFAVRPDREKMLPEFFAYLAQSPYGKAYFLKVAHKTTNLACINSTKLKAFPVPVPPTLDEQREIVAILDAIDRKIDLHRRKRAVLDELFKALLHKLMTGEIRVADLDLSALTPASPGKAA
ncbi:restriction endonuclease subunit S [Parvibaculum sp.]|uniref:restriction endonuclease subunit S n=1 Tax=Parvibaculum sp. TaxID=2024848 RepID=UPI0034A01514